jgi:hypothetical protein
MGPVPVAVVDVAGEVVGAGDPEASLASKALSAIALLISSAQGLNNHHVAIIMRQRC